MNILCEFARMCRAVKMCSDCPIGEATEELGMTGLYRCTDYLMEHPGEAKRIVREWADKRPEAMKEEAP